MPDFVGVLEETVNGMIETRSELLKVVKMLRGKNFVKHAKN
jgi:hypothetical protein